MTGQRITRVSRVDAAPAAFCLVSVSPDVSHASRPLDLKVVGTEGENAFVGTIKHNQLDSLRAKGYKGSTSEWENVLSRTLLHTPVRGDNVQALEGLDAVSTVTGNSELTIIWRRSKRGTTHELGSLTLTQTEEETIELYDWLALAVQRADAAEDEVESLKRQVDEQTQTNAKLRDQLQGLTEAKLQHEDALLHKFSELMNSKKLKIRDQQRLLAGAKVDPTAAIQVQDSRSSTRTRRTEVSARASKRKASGRGQTDSEEDDSESDAFEDVPMKDAEEDRATPERSDQDSDDPPPKPKVRRAIGGKAKKAATPASAAASTVKPAKLPGRNRAIVDEEKTSEVDDEPPPRRELPFARAVPASKAAPAPVADDSETDDEL